MPSEPFRRRTLLAGIFLLGVALVVGLGAWYLRRDTAPTPPAVELADADPEVAAAVEAARTAVLEAPRSASAWGHLGMVLRAHAFGAEANECFIEAARLDPQEARWPYLHGLTLLLTEPDAGIRQLQRTVELCHDGPLAPRLRLGEALLAQGRLDEAEEHLRRVLQTEPANPRARLGLGQLAYQREDLKGSLEHLRFAAASTFTRKAARTLLAAVYQRLGDPAALQELGAVAALPDDPPWPDLFVEEVEQLVVGTQVRIAQADELLWQGRGPEAVALLSETVTRHGESDRAWLALGRTLVRLNDFAAAEPALKKATDLAPDSVEAWFQRGVALYGLGEVGRAADCFRRTTRLKSDHALAHYNLGLCLKRQGDQAGAAAAFRYALRYKPDYAPARTELDALTQP